MFEIHQLTSTDYIDSTWSGGQTRQVYIFPPTSHYGDRNFDYRISTATVELASSVFTSLPAYERHLMTLDKEIKLIHTDSQNVVSLAPYQPYSFSGADPIESQGTCTDFNLIHSPYYEGMIEALPANQKVFSRKGKNHLFYFLDNQTVEIDHELYDLHKGDSLLVTSTTQETELVLHLSGPATNSSVIAIWAGICEKEK